MNQSPQTKLHATTEFDAWFKEARLRIPNGFEVETKSLDTDEEPNRVMLILSDESYHFTLIIMGGGFVNVDQPVYGAVDYDIFDRTADRGRCDVIVVHSKEMLNTTLDKCLNEFLALASGDLV